MSLANDAIIEISILRLQVCDTSTDILSQIKKVCDPSDLLNEKMILFMVIFKNNSNGRSKDFQTGIFSYISKRLSKMQEKVHLKGNLIQGGS